VSGKAYAAGNIVLYSNKKLYVAKFANPGYNPTISTYFWAPYTCTDVSAPSPAPAPTPAPAPSPAPSPSVTYACTFPSWIQGGYYSAGKIVLYSDGRLYVATRANPGYNPTISTYFWSLYKFPAWVSGKSYAAGSIVSYKNGKNYIAKFTNPGYDPTQSTYYWALYGC
jgi:chitinase